MPGGGDAIGDRWRKFNTRGGGLLISMAVLGYLFFTLGVDLSPENRRLRTRYTQPDEVRRGCRHDATDWIAKTASFRRPAFGKHRCVFGRQLAKPLKAGHCLRAMLPLPPTSMAPRAVAAEPGRGKDFHF